MTMAIPVRVLRPNDLPRQCRDASGSPKVLYVTRGDARRTVRLYRSRVPGLHAYGCDRCQGFHIGRPRTVRS